MGRRFHWALFRGGVRLENAERVAFGVDEIALPADLGNGKFWHDEISLIYSDLAQFLATGRVGELLAAPCLLRRVRVTPGNFSRHGTLFPAPAAWHAE
jgi:hypothetical protein